MAQARPDNPRHESAHRALPPLPVSARGRVHQEWLLWSACHRLAKPPFRQILAGFGPDLEGAKNIAPPRLCRRHLALAGRRPRLFQEQRNMRLSRPTRGLFSAQNGLVVAPPPPSPPGQRRRHDDVGTVEQHHVFDRTRPGTWARRSPCIKPWISPLEASSYLNNERARSKLCRLAWRNPQSVSPPGSDLKGVPHLAQTAPAVNAIADQHAGHKVCGSATRWRRAAHSGGENISSKARPMRRRGLLRGLLISARIT